MVKLIGFILFFLSSLSGFTQDNYDSDLIPSTLKNRANAVIRNEETMVDMRSTDNVLRSVKQAITVLNKNGEDNARLVLFYDRNTAIKSIKGEVYNASGILTKKFSQSNFRDESTADGFSLFVDSRVKHYLPNESTYPYTVVYTYEIKYKQNLIIPDWVPKTADDISVEKSTYTFICKPGDELRIKTQSYTGKPEEIINDKQKTIFWKVNNLLAVKSEPYSPNAETYQTNVKIAPKQFDYYNYKGSYTNWNQLGKWVYDDLLKGRSALSHSTIETIKELVKNETTAKAKAKKIYEYMQNKTRYISVQIGIGGFQPVTAAEVDRLGYGDCKALVNYTQSLLSVAGIESYYCVVQAGSEKISLDPSFASMIQGNHVILCMPLKGDTTWLECTSQKIPFGFLSDFTDDRIVLACTAEGGKLLRTPKLSSQDNRQIRYAELTILSNGDANGKIKTVFSGLQYNTNEDIIGKPLAEQQKLLNNIYNVDNINFSSVDYVQKKGIYPEIDENITLNIRSYASINNHKMLLQLNAFNVKSSISELRNRIQPVYINRGFVEEDTITYNLPEEILTDLLPENDKNIKTPFGEYICKTTLNGKKLTYYRKFIINDGTFPPQAYSNFSKFINDVNSADNYKVILSLKK
ncbi:DUF3857 domain-containing protein [Pedobacter mendelii]|uniref:DUF3857 domain-containing protein n=1 Tax=Pedobacter mendelii TaxID=1908240 RepID=A0ABQ2BJ45_9SPHI|nr:DUF3857 domain-containing transglutaminase family protein [Pedobacter mendelii]GGI26266.1 hypothetical protein GCM10008119_21800 [Pedobacter mendelii]